jgi:hypothetical protein
MKKDGVKRMSNKQVYVMKKRTQGISIGKREQ